MAQDYKVKEFKPWIDRETGQDITDNYGNVKGTLVLDGVGEPVDATFKKAPSAGDTLYGHIEDYTTRQGSTRQKFKREQKEQVMSGKKSTYDNNGQKHGNALKIASETLLKLADFKGEDEFVERLEKLAYKIYSIPVPVVAGESEQPKGDWIDPEVKAKLQTAKQSNDELDAEMNSLIESEEPINLDDIPF